MSLISKMYLLNKRRVAWIDGLKTTYVTTSDIFDAPEIDAVPSVHAKWVKNDLFEHRCTNCGNRIPFFHCYSEEHDDEWDEEIDLTKFCPNCGAMMDAE